MVLEARKVLAVAITVMTTLWMYMTISLFNNPADLFELNNAPTKYDQGFGHGVKNRHIHYLTVEELSRNPPAGSIVCPENLVPIYDRPSSSDQINTEYIEYKTAAPRKIPRSIHASMKSRCVSRDTHDAMQAWKDALPRHSFYFHDDDAVDRLFNMAWEEFPQLTSIMRCVRFKGAMRIDVWRILIIYRYGGIYTDADIFPNETFNEADPIGADDEAVFSSDHWNRPSQWFFAMEPKHPIAYYTMLRIFSNLLELKNIERPPIVFVTGPQALKVGYTDAMYRTDIADPLAEGTYECKWGKTVKKISRGRVYVHQLDPFEMVEWDGAKMTRRERMERLTGQKHWVDEWSSKKIEFDGSCRDYLYALDHGLNMSLNNSSNVTMPN